MKWVAKIKEGSRCFSKSYFRELRLFNEIGNRKERGFLFLDGGTYQDILRLRNCVSRQNCPSNNWKYEVGIQKIVLG